MNYDRAYRASCLSAYAYATEEQVKKACKSIGLTGKLISKNGAEVLVARGGGELWFAFRGTQPDKLNDVMADLNVIRNSSIAGGKVHTGFQDEVNELWMDCLKEIENNNNLKKPKKLFFTGHSLGAAMATIAASRCSAEELYTFGSPRVGGRKFTKNLDCPHYRFVNNNDIVCTVPPAILGFKHDGEKIYFNAYGQVRALTSWQRVKDFFRGIWSGWKQGKFLDMFTDHGIWNYIKNIEDNKDNFKVDE
jgi:triacylglycerol lipase